MSSELSNKNVLDDNQKLFASDPNASGKSAHQRRLRNGKAFRQGQNIIGIYGGIQDTKHKAPTVGHRGRKGGWIDNRNSANFFHSIRALIDETKQGK